MITHRIGFLGAGQMASALGQGLVKTGIIAPEMIMASDPVAEARERFSRLTGARCVESNLEVARNQDVLVLAVKPQHMPAVLQQVRGHLRQGALVVSIAAGIRIGTIQEGIGPDVRVVRVIPNTPCLVGKGASAYALGPTATADDARLVSQLLGAVGRAWEVEERLLDAVTGLSGSGPAYVFLMIEALSDGGVRMGLPRSVATALAAQTVLGAAEMVLTTGDHPAVLKDRVASPGGTTIAGLAALESGAVRAALIAAVEAAARRSAELAKAL